MKMFAGLDVGFSRTAVCVCENWGGKLAQALSRALARRRRRLHVRETDRIKQINCIS